jgi:23S rRNA (uracil1939-C5)-methyltransferase
MMEGMETNYVVTAVDLTHDGLGVCKLEDGFTVFIDGLLKGERAEIIVNDRRKSYGFGTIINLLERSPFRTTPKCVLYDVCGGCNLMHMDYDVQLSFKKYRIETSLKRAGMENVIVNDMIGMTVPYHYRNKIEIKFHQGEKGLEAGFFRAKSHDLVNLTECHIMPKRIMDLIILIKHVADELGITAYDETKDSGSLKSAVIRESGKTKALSLLLQLGKNHFPNKELFVKKLTAKISELASIACTVTKDESTMSTDPIDILYGSETIVDAIGNLDFEIGYRSFFQTNILQTEQLYQKAMEYAGLTGKEKIIDAYCGIGTIGMVAAPKAFKVFGIEVIKSAIQDARKNAEKNGIKNAFFEVGEAEEVIKKWKPYKFDVVFIDPPRKGCDPKFLQAIMDMKVQKIVYVSCDPATLVRDLQTLTEGGYDVKEVTPVDMFPQTIHVETVTLLERK